MDNLVDYLSAHHFKESSPAVFKFWVLAPVALAGPLGFSLNFKHVSGRYIAISRGEQLVIIHSCS